MMNTFRFVSVVVSVMLAQATATCLAQSSSPVGVVSSNEQMWLELFTTLTPTGFLTWYCWYTTAKTLPRFQSRFGEEAAAVRTAHMAIVERQCKDFHETLAAVIAQQKIESADHRTAIERMTEMIVTTARHCPGPKEKELSP